MPKYLFTAQYSSGSWARLVKGSDDRTAAVRSLIESLGGSLDQIYWSAHSCAAHAIAELPDGIAAKAAINTALRTGAFANVEATELLSQDQLSDTLLLARTSQQFYEAPGMSAVQAASYL
jgi:uncharacterized protein with GYD domain